MKKLLFAIMLFLFCIYVGEIFLGKKYVAGYQTHYTGFEIVDSLIVYEDYSTDQHGNYILSNLVTEIFKNSYDNDFCIYKDSMALQRLSNVDGIKTVISDFCILKQIQTPKESFEKFSNILFQKKILDKTDSACLAYIDYPFNAQGYRSIAFENYESDKIKVFIIGDSFVWGMSAKPYYNSFTDLLLANGYLVFSAGLPSVDPIQYWSICKNYVDSINPDIVILNFYEGNDIMNKKRIHQANKPHEHITNAGFFESYIEGEYLPPQKAYEYYKNLMRIPTNNLINKLLSKTAIGSIIWTQTHLETRYQYQAELTEDEGVLYTKLYIDSIAGYLTDKNIPYFFAIIPRENVDYNKNKIVLGYDTSKVKQVFNDLEYHVPNNLTHEDYNEPKDIHFNNAGSLKYAIFIDSIIKTKINIE